MVGRWIKVAVMALVVVFCNRTGPGDAEEFTTAQQVRDRIVQDLIDFNNVAAALVDDKPGDLRIDSVIGRDSWSFAVGDLLPKLQGLSDEDQDVVFDSQRTRILKLIDETPFDPSQIVPVFRHLDYIGAEDATIIRAAIKAGTDLSELKTRHPFIAMYGDLLLLYYRMTPLSMKLLAFDELNAAGITDDRLFPLAAQNANGRARTKVTEIVDGGLLRATFADEPRLNSVMLLWENVLKKAEETFGTDYLLVFPAAETGLHIARRSDPEAVAKLQKVIEVAKRRHGLSVTADVLESTLIYERVDGKIVWKGLK